jgi:hypothetical protein
MGVIIKAGWNKKSQGEPFGSEGTFVGFEIEVDDEYLTPARHGDLLKNVQTLQLLAREAVEKELADAIAENREKYAADQQAAADRDADRRAAEQRRDDRPRRDERRADDRGRDRDDRPRRDERPRDQPRGHSRDIDRRRNGSGGGGGRRKDWKNDGGRPRTGKELFGYSKDWNAERWFKDYGRDNNLPSYLSEWRDDEVDQAVDAFETALELEADRERNGAAY